MPSPAEIAALRHDYAAHGLRRAELDSDPIAQFSSWFTAAIETQIRDVNAMSLATSTTEGRPSVRIVLLKGFSPEGFVFYTNYESEKGRELGANRHAALAFFWAQFERQVRVTGTVEKTSREESERYFHSRPFGSQLGAWVSQQSETVASREALDVQLAEATQRFGGSVIPLPENWGGYRLQPETIEFWQGRPNRMHDRFLYRRAADAPSGWTIDRLAP